MGLREGRKKYSIATSSSDQYHRRVQMLNARPQYLHCISNGDTAILHKAIDMTCFYCITTEFLYCRCADQEPVHDNCANISFSMANSVIFTYEFRKHPQALWHLPWYGDKNWLCIKCGNHNNNAEVNQLLTHCGLLTPCGHIYLGQHWLRQWLVA